MSDDSFPQTLGRKAPLSDVVFVQWLMGVKVASMYRLLLHPFVINHGLSAAAGYAASVAGFASFVICDWPCGCDLSACGFTTGAAGLQTLIYRVLSVECFGRLVSKNKGCT